MKTMMLFKNSVLVALIAALAFAALPLMNASAASQAGPFGGALGSAGDTRLETGWARMHVTYDRLGRLFDSSNLRIERTQKFIKRLNAQGVDTTDLQAALDAFEAAVKAANPLYQSAKGILNSHHGFDEAGLVVDHGKAAQTVKDMGDKLRSIRDAMNDTGKALRDLTQQYRQKYPQSTLTPASGAH